jgi:hypothetical protein
MGRFHPGSEWAAWFLMKPHTPGASPRHADFRIILRPHNRRSTAECCRARRRGRRALVWSSCRFDSDSAEDSARPRVLARCELTSTRLTLSVQACLASPSQGQSGNRVERNRQECRELPARGSVFIPDWLDRAARLYKMIAPGIGEVRLDTVSPSPASADVAVRSMRRCVFCCEEIHPSASICPHCTSNLVPLQRLSDERAALEERVAVLEQSLAELQLAQSASAESIPPSIAAVVEAVPSPASVINWPHMAENVFLGLVVLVAAHWLATTLPVSSRPLFRLVALVVALPFGYRFERYTRSTVSEQVIAALAYGCVGTLALGLLDMALGELTPHLLRAPDIVATVAAISLSHFAGSGLAQARRGCAERAASVAAARSSGLLPHLQAAQIKSTADTVKSVYEALTPVAAGGAAVWAAFNHISF